MYRLSFDMMSILRDFAAFELVTGCCRPDLRQIVYEQRKSMLCIADYYFNFLPLAMYKAKKKRRMELTFHIEIEKTI